MNGPVSFPPAGPGRDHIRITVDGQAPRVVPVPSNEFTIGRSSKNALTIQDNHASRQHVRIRFDGRQYHVMDRGSKNGTFLGKKNLLAAAEELWPTEKELRIGDHTFQLISAQAATTMQEQAKQATPPPDPSVPMQPSRPQSVRPESSQLSSKSPTAISSARKRAGNLQLDVSAAEITIEPGAMATLTAEAINTSDEVVHYTIGVTGIPAEWVRVTPYSELKLLNKKRETVTIYIQPPASIKTRAGRFRFYVEATSNDPQDPVVKIKGTLIIGTFGQFQAELRQTQAKVGETLRILVKNRSNGPCQFALSCWDDAKALRFTIPKKTMMIDAGQSATMDFTAHTRHKRWIGGPKNHTFQAKVSTKGEQDQTKQGTFISRGIFPTWLPPLVLAVIVAAAGLGQRAYTQHQQAIATLTAEASATAETAAANALATTTAIAAATQTAEAQAATAAALQASELTATSTAATATAVWLEEDSDRDGLINRREVELNLLPNSDDTDNDGLRDGDEVDIHQTNPLVADTDGEGWSDGLEVERGTDPLDVDSDDDGEPDNTDPDPVRLPTATPDLNATEAAIRAITADARTFVAIQTATQEARNAIATATQEAKEAMTAEAQRQQNAAATRDQQAANAQATSDQQARDSRATADTVAKQTSDARATEAARPTPTPRPTPVPAPRTTGMKLAEFCRRHGFSGVDRDGRTVFSWYCTPSGRHLTQTDYDQLCQEQERNLRAFARYKDFNNHLSWECVIP